MFIDRFFRREMVLMKRAGVIMFAVLTVVFNPLVVSAETGSEPSVFHGRNGSDSTSIRGGKITYDTGVSRRSPVVDVRAYGVVPDDGQDDGEALRALFADLRDGATVFFPDGRYRIDLNSDSQGLVLSGDSVTIMGQGPATELVVPDGELPADGRTGTGKGHDGVIVIDTGTLHPTIKHLAIDGNRDAPGNRGSLTAVRILPGTVHPRVEHVMIEEMPNRGRGVTLNQHQSGTRTRGAVLDDLYARAVHKPVDAFYQVDLTVKNSHFVDIFQDAVEINATHSFEVRNNLCRNVDLHCLETSGTHAPGGGRSGIVAENRSEGSNFENTVGNSASFDLKDSRNLWVSGNQVLDGAGIGIRLGRSGKTTNRSILTDNRIQGVARGIVVNGNNNYVSGNYIRDSDSEALVINGIINTAASNVMTNHDRLDNGNPMVRLPGSHNILQGNLVAGDPPYSGASDDFLNGNFGLDRQWGSVRAETIRASEVLSGEIQLRRSSEKDSHAMRAGDFDADHDHQVEAADTAAACEGPEGHCTVRGVVHPVHQTSRDVSTTADTTYYVIDTSESARTLTLSASTARPGRVIHVKRKGSHRVRIVAEGSAAVDGSSAITLTEDGESVTLVFNQETNTWEVF